jgi:two-component system chemotaxis sensor kinase CheA
MSSNDTNHAGNKRKGQMKDIDFSRFADKFIDDAHNLLNEIETKLLELEQSPGSHDLIESVFRSMHTLKGIGAMFGFNLVSDYTHHLESIYDKIRNNQRELDTSIVELTLVSVDHLRNLLHDREMKNQILGQRHASLLAQLEKIDVTDEVKKDVQAVKRMKADTSSSWYIQFVCSEDLINRAVNIGFLFQDLSKIGTYSIFSHSKELNSEFGEEELWGIMLTTDKPYDEIEGVFMFVMDNVKIIQLTEGFAYEGDENSKYKGSINELSALFSTGSEKETEPSPRALQKDQNKANNIPRISISADKVDKLMYLVSELFTTRSELMVAAGRSDMPAVKLAVEKIDKLSALFRKNALSIRLVPLKELTLKFKRLVRDLSKDLSKNIEFEINGDDTELDKNLVDSIADPLMHILRNAIDHGIESPEERLQRNKPEKGTVRFLAYQSGNYIYIQVSDDGKGIDKDVLLKKAIEKNIVSPQAKLTDKEILDLIFVAGFSTASSLTKVSGRGVGMDVVKNTINNLRGSIEIDTELDKGTCITIKLQQTIAIMDTLLVRSGNSFFTIILEDVEVCGLESHLSIEDRYNNHLEIAGELIPYISLRQVFSLEGSAQEIERIVVIKHQTLRYAILVDSIVGQYQAVVKPMGQVFKHKDYLSGASIMGDGNIAFMLDSKKLSDIKTKSEIYG